MSCTKAQAKTKWKKNQVSLLDQKSVISIDLKTVIFETDIDAVWGDRWG